MSKSKSKTLYEVRQFSNSIPGGFFLAADLQSLGRFISRRNLVVHTIITRGVCVDTTADPALTEDFNTTEQEQKK